MPNSDNDGNDNRWIKNGYGQVVDHNRGKFNEEESEMVRQAVREYCSAKDISVERLCSECEHKSELKGSWMEIAKSLPHRSVQSVYRHGIRILHPFKRGAWSFDEVQMLFDLVERHGKKWVFVGKKLNRLADACRDKYREQCEDYSKGRWKDEETEALKNIIREHLGVPPSTTMVETGKMVSDQGISLPWEAITKRMGTRSRLSCYKKFQKMANLLSPSDRKIVEKRQSKSSKARKKSAAAAATAATPDAHTFVEDDDNNMNAAGDIDMDLLSELIATGASRSSEVDWNALHIDDAQNRWHALIGEWQQQEGEEETDEALTSLPLFELAQLLLDRKSSARAAETVEAVDLPNPSTLLV